MLILLSKQIVKSGLAVVFQTANDAEDAAKYIAEYAQRGWTVRWCRPV